jgi:sensor histidine kinase YesM
LRGWQLAAAIVVAVAVSVVVWHAFTLHVLRDELGMRVFREEVAGPVDWTAGMLYHAWLMLFFGGLATVVAASQRWRRRMLSTLRATEIARATSQQRLAEARLATLEARVNPDYLYRTLSRLERLYEEDPPAADRLLDELIAFLRGALAGSRTPTLKDV